jgi:hypothetical protein
VAEACEPYCGLFDQPGGELGIDLCPECGTFWELRIVTEVDLETGLPTKAAAGWVSVARG